MSTLGLENMNYYKFESELPKWMKNERYEYCEQVSEEVYRTGKRHHALIQMFLSLFF